MCTLSIFRNSDTLKITMNRDERLDREAERAPYLWDNGIIAPQDSQSGGTWIGAHPKIQKWACLLNGYAERDSAPKQNTKSRGGIIPSYLTQDIDAFHEYIDNNKHAYVSFRLIYGDKETVHEMTWDGQNLNLNDIGGIDDGFFRSSSSYKQNQVVSHRKVIFMTWLKNPQYVCAIDVPSFHISCDDQDKSSSILMQRDNPKRATTSITMIEMSGKATQVHYLSSQYKHTQCLSALAKEDISDNNIKTISHA